MKLTLNDPKLLKESISIISDLVSEAQFNVTPDGFSLVALDPATVAMVDFKLLSPCFSEFQVDGEQETISVNLLNLKQVLRRVGSSDSVTLEIFDNKLKLTINGSSKRTFFLPLIDLESNTRKVPNIDYTATVALDSQRLVNAIDDADIVAESVAFIADKNSFSVAAEGDLSKVIVEISKDADTKIVLSDQVDPPVKAKYSIEYLKKLVQGAKLADKVLVQLGSDLPVRLDYKVLNKLQLVFILAPRVEDE